MTQSSQGEGDRRTFTALGFFAVLVDLGFPAAAAFEAGAFCKTVTHDDNAWQ